MLKRLNGLMGKSSPIVPWVSLAGCLFFLGGLGLDGMLHRLNPYLAMNENIMNLTNPAHLLMALGIGLIVVSTVLFLINQVKQLKQRSVLKEILLIGAIFCIIGLCGITLGLGIKDTGTSNPVVPVVPNDLSVPLSINDATNLTNKADYSFYFPKITA